MAEKKSSPAVQKETTKPYNIFSKDNYLWMLGGILVIAIGFFLMAGGKSNDPNVFNEKEVYSTTRITVAPILIILGLSVLIFAVFRKPKG
jgi:hypothetical protein